MIKSAQGRFRSVVVITSASHAEGHGLSPAGNIIFHFSIAQSAECDSARVVSSTLTRVRISFN